LTLLVVTIWAGCLRWERHRKKEKRALEGMLDDIEAHDAASGINKKAG